MKASLKFREEEKPPLLRVKVPLSILGFPFQSGLSACGDSKDLSLNLTTFFESGPSLKLVYKPNDSWNPFSLVVKTGIGPFGSPISAPLSMSAEFNLISPRGNPSFFLRFNPQFGDFSVKKSSGSQSVFINNTKIGKSDEKVGVNIETESIVDAGKLVSENGVWSNVVGNVVGNVVDGLVSGVEVSAKTLLPIRNHAVVKFRWGVRLPAENEDGAGIKNYPMAGISFSKIPFLVMNKLSIEHAAGGGDSKKKKKKDDRGVEVEVEEACLGVKRQLDVLHAENGLLRRAVDELRSEIGVGKLGLLAGNGNVESRKFRGERRSGGERKGGLDFSGFPGKVTDEDANEEVKKGLMSSAAGT